MTSAIEGPVPCSSDYQQQAFDSPIDVSVRGAA